MFKYFSGAGAALAISTLFFASHDAQASTVNYTFDTTSCVSTLGGSCSSGSWSTTRTYEGDDGSTVTVSGWSNTEGTDNENLEQGEITHWSGGLGVRNSDYSGTDFDAYEGSSPEHAIDNNDRYDLVLFEFDTALSLNYLDLDWYSGDADVTILAYTGGGSGSIAGLDAYAGGEELTSNGWSLIGNFDVDYFSTMLNFDSGGIFSNRWIISAYNSAFGSDCNPVGYCQDSSYLDYFKIDVVGGTVAPVPLPAAGSLLLIALGGLGLFRRRS